MYYHITDICAPKKMKTRKNNMTERKYIITEFGGPVIFDSLIYHFELGLNAVSAGFVKIWTDSESDRLKVSCYGGNTLMGLTANPDQDEKIMEEFLNMK